MKDGCRRLGGGFREGFSGGLEVREAASGIYGRNCRDSQNAAHRVFESRSR